MDAMAAEQPLFDPNRLRAAREAHVAQPPPAVPRTMTVSQLNALINRVLGDNLPGTLHLIGEISNCCHHASGHLYLTLKDDRSEIRTVMWRKGARALKFRPADGMEVVATGSVEVYEPRGQYQFLISRLEPRGVGALELAFRQLREKLEREGLFDPARKRPLPRFPRRIAVVTSPAGAAIRDVLTTLGRRFPCASVLLHPVRVQGEGAASDIAAAIQRLNDQASSLGGIDVMIVARGGGSLEDLWAFNEEVVARAIVESRIPVISGVGHEVDVTIADLAADKRAATPTAAAELAVPVLAEVLDQLASQALRLSRTVQHRLQLAESRLSSVQRFEWFRDPMGVLNRSEQRVDEASSRLRVAIDRGLTRLRHRLHRAELALGRIQPASLVRRKWQRLDQIDHRLHWVIMHRLRAAERRLTDARTGLLAASPQRWISMDRQQLRQVARDLQRVLNHRVELVHRVLETTAGRLEQTDHRRTLARGYTITRTRRGRIITRPGDVKPGDRIVTQTAQGDLESRVTDARQPELFE
jgi:exodeoxyribonuclease VII large subunit